MKDLQQEIRPDTTHTLLQVCIFPSWIFLDFVIYLQPSLYFMIVIRRVAKCRAWVGFSNISLGSGQVWIFSKFINLKNFLENKCEK